MDKDKKPDNKKASVKTCVPGIDINGVAYLDVLTSVREILRVPDADKADAPNTVEVGKMVLEKLWGLPESNPIGVNIDFVAETISAAEDHLIAKRMHDFLTKDLIAISKNILFFERARREVEREEIYGNASGDPIPRLIVLSKAYAQSSILSDWIGRGSELGAYLFGYRARAATRLETLVTSVSRSLISEEEGGSRQFIDYNAIFRKHAHGNVKILIEGVHASAVKGFLSTESFNTLKTILVTKPETVDNRVNSILVKCFKDHLHQPTGSAPLLPFPYNINETDDVSKIVYAAAFLVYQAGKYPPVVETADVADAINGFVYLFMLILSTHSHVVHNKSAIRANAAMLMALYIDEIGGLRDANADAVRHSYNDYDDDDEGGGGGVMSNALSDKENAMTEAASDEFKLIVSFSENRVDDANDMKETLGALDDIGLLARIMTSFGNMQMSSSGPDASKDAQIARVRRILDQLKSGDEDSPHLTKYIEQKSKIFTQKTNDTVSAYAKAWNAAIDRKVKEDAAKNKKKKSNESGAGAGRGRGRGQGRGKGA